MDKKPSTPASWEKGFQLLKAIHKQASETSITLTTLKGYTLPHSDPEELREAYKVEAQNTDFSRDREGWLEYLWNLEDGEWGEDPFSDLVTLYNYQFRLLVGEDFPTVEEIRDWHLDNG